MTPILSPVTETPPPQPSLVPAVPRPKRVWLRKLITAIFVLAFLAGAGYAAYRFRPGQTAAILPSAPARQGDFLVIIRCRGDLKAGRSTQVYTPLVPNLRIAWLAPPGELAK